MGSHEFDQLTAPFGFDPLRDSKPRCRYFITKQIVNLELPKKSSKLYFLPTHSVPPK